MAPEGHEPAGKGVDENGQAIVLCTVASTQEDDCEVCSQRVVAVVADALDVRREIVPRMASCAVSPPLLVRFIRSTWQFVANTIAGYLISRV